MKRIGIVRLFVVWLACGVLLWWARGVGVVQFKVSSLCSVGAALGSTWVTANLGWLLFPVLFVPLLLTWLRFPARGSQ